MRNYQLTCQASVDAIDELDDFCQQVIAQLQAPEADKLCFALHEAIVNAVKAYAQAAAEGGEGGLVSVEIDDFADYIEFRVIDRAGGFDPSVMERMLSSSLEDRMREESGRGFLMMARLMDEVVGVCTPDGRTIITLVKRRSGRNGE